MALLRPLLPEDLPQLIEVYRQAVLDQAPPLYSPRQVAAWAGHSAGVALEAELSAGFGLASCSEGAPRSRPSPCCSRSIASRCCIAAAAPAARVAPRPCWRRWRTMAAEWV